jgi:hypothetical protein
MYSFNGTNVSGEAETQIQSPDNIQHLRLFCDKCFYKYIFNISYQIYNNANILVFSDSALNENELI